ncbi:hypothetical protein MA9V2_184 [Chryseobacterium phage MA9V-2]|nr:hypothetical protein MA9V2_184 [Chryseobacterium phage MA9V-2]
MATQTSKNINDFLGELHRLYNVGLKYQEVIQKAMVATTDYVTIDVPSIDGNAAQTITVPSFTYIQTQQQAIINNMNAMSKLQDGSGYAVLVDEVNGKIRQLFELSYNEAPYIATNILPTPATAKAFVDEQNALINKLAYPNLSYALDCTQLIRSYSRKVQLRKINITNYNNYADNQAELLGLQNIDEVKAFLGSKSIAYEDTSSIEEVEYYQSRYYGDFSVLESVRNADGTFTAKLDTLNYSDRQNAVRQSRELAKGSKLAMLNENTLFSVVSVNLATKSVTLQRVYGFDELLVGVSNLTYLDDNTKRNVNVPLRYGENVLLFFAATHLIHGTMSGYSKPFAYSTHDLQISAGADLMSVNDYLKASNASDVKTVLQSFISQQPIPLKYAVTPNKPQVDLSMFKVVQINKHIVDGSDIEYIKKLYESQRKIAGDMKITNTKISDLKSALEQSNYKNESDRKQIAKELETEQSKYVTQQTEYSTIVGELSNKDIGLYASTYAPKYRVRGFWPVQDDMASEYTRNQVVLAYKVQFRYVSANNKIANSDNFSLKERVEGEEVETTGSFSVWQEFITPLRKRTLNADGSVTYEPNNITDADQINLNQLDIAIQNNEQVDVRIQAISEVGYPGVQITSEWSDTVRVNFPPEFTTDIDFTKLQDEVNVAKQELALRGLLQNEGLIQHIKNSSNEQNIYFAHKATEIDSGWWTAERNKVPLFDKLSEMAREIEALRNIIVNQASTMSLSLIDGQQNVHKVTNNATLKIFAGYYTDDATTKPAGDIATYQMYLKLSNTQVSQVYSLDPGDNALVTSIADYRKAPVGYINDDGNAILPYGTPQTHAQIAYLRSRNVINNGDLYESNPALATPWSNTVPAGSIDTGATDPQKNVIHISAGQLAKVALNDSDNTKFIAMHKDHPDYQETGANVKIKAYLEKMSTMLTIPESKQLETDADNQVKTWFEVNDKFLVGELTTGAYLTFNAMTQSGVKVASNAIDAYKEVGPNTDILIPIMFQFRMTDALGRINGKPNVTDTNITYTKRIGIDILLNGVMTKFDIEVSAKYTPTALAANNLPKAGTQLNFNNGSSMN